MIVFPQVGSNANDRSIPLDNTNWNKIPTCMFRNMCVVKFRCTKPMSICGRTWRDFASICMNCINAMDVKDIYNDRFNMES